MPKDSNLFYRIKGHNINQFWKDNFNQKSTQFSSQMALVSQTFLYKVCDLAAFPLFVHAHASITFLEDFPPIFFYQKNVICLDGFTCFISYFCIWFKNVLQFQNAHCSKRKLISYYCKNIDKNSSEFNLNLLRFFEMNVYT